MPDHCSTTLVIDENSIAFSTSQDVLIRPSKACTAL
jgi:hypothetical protein